MLGGTSGINTLVWGRGSSAEYDSWNSFAANQGWTWASLLPYMKKSETLSLVSSNPYPGISEQQAEKTQQDLPRVDGFSGPINVSIINYLVLESNVDCILGLLYTILLRHRPTDGQST